MKKIIIIMGFMSAIALLQADSESPSRARSWVNDMRDSRWKEADCMTEEELHALSMKNLEHFTMHYNEEAEACKETLASQSESAQAKEQKGNEGLVAQWQKFLSQIIAYFYSK